MHIKMKRNTSLEVWATFCYLASIFAWWLSIPSYTVPPFVRAMSERACVHLWESKRGSESELFYTK